MSENSTFFSIKFTEESAVTNEKHSLLVTSDKTWGGGTTHEGVTFSGLYIEEVPPDSCWVKVLG